MAEQTPDFDSASVVRDATGGVRYVVGTPEQMAQNPTPDAIRVATMAGQTPTVYVTSEWMAALELSQQ